MAVFICECCGATLKKQQIDRHCQTKCRNAWSFTCVECSKTFDGYEYKEHNQCMTEVEKYQGKFLERQRQAKLEAKKQRQTDKVANNIAQKPAEKEKEESKVEKSENQENNEITEAEAIQLRRFLKDGCEFNGLDETAIAVLKKESSRQLKLRVLSKKISQIFRLSEDYDSDESDIEDDVKWLINKKQIRKKLAKQTNAHL